MDIHGSRLYCTDAVAGAAEHLADDSVDLIVTDPPYGIEGDRLHRHYNRNEDCVIDGYIEVPACRYGDFTRAWISQAERVLRPGGSIYVLSGYTNLYDVLSALRATGLREVNHLIWKYNFGVFTRRKYVSSHYHILYYYKPGGLRTFNMQSRYATNELAAAGGSANYQDREDVFVINREYKPGREKNKNELPTELLVKLLQYSSNDGDLVCDFFMGGCSTARVAIGMNRRFVGFELSPPIFNSRVPQLRDVVPGELRRQTAHGAVCASHRKRRQAVECGRRRRVDAAVSRSRAAGRDETRNRANVVRGFQARIVGDRKAAEQRERRPSSIAAVHWDPVGAGL